MKITSVTAQRNDPDRVNIAIDGEFAFGLSADLALEAGLHAGLELDDAAVKRLLRQDPAQQPHAHSH